MSRVEIKAGDRQVIVDHAGELAHLASTALDLWKHTDTPARPAPPAAGFAVNGWADQERTAGS